MRAPVLAGVVGMVVVAAHTVAAATWTGGLKSGVNFADFRRANGGLDDTHIHAGFMGGGFVQAAFAPHAGLRIEALWVSKGAESVSDDGTLELDYVEFPVLLVVGIPAGDRTAFNVFLGPTFGANTSATFDDNGANIDVGSAANAFEFGIAMGVGFEYAFSSLSVVLDGRYAVGINSAFADETDGGWPQMSNRGIGIMAGVAFPLGNDGQ